ncbi:MAG: DUF3179 domain-containing protein [Wenzhouxiangella sp.]
MQKFNPRLLAFPGGRWLGWAIGLAIIVPMAWQHYQRSQPYNGFSLDRLSIPEEQLETGGPGRDDIPALTDPRTISPQLADYLAPEAPVIGIAVNGESRAYPYAILNWHEIINDRLGGEAIVVSYCPLCGSGVAFEGALDGRRLLFGVSGLLYQENLLLYDRGTASLWSQMTGTAISGPMLGRQLRQLPIEHVTWSQWQASHPDTDVLSVGTGYRRDYQHDPYREYRIALAARGVGDSRLPANALVIGVQYKGVTKAYPFSVLAKTKPDGRFQDFLHDDWIEIAFDATTRSAAVQGSHGEPIPFILSYWFAWHAFNPDTLLHAADEI